MGETESLLLLANVMCGLEELKADVHAANALVSMKNDVKNDAWPNVRLVLRGVTDLPPPVPKAEPPQWKEDAMSAIRSVRLAEKAEKKNGHANVE